MERHVTNVTPRHKTTSKHDLKQLCSKGCSWLLPVNWHAQTCSTGACRRTAGSLGRSCRDLKPPCSLARSHRAWKAWTYLDILLSVGYRSIPIDTSGNCGYCSRMPYLSDPVRTVQMGTRSASIIKLGVSENSVPLNPMVLLIIIPIKWL